MEDILIYQEGIVIDSFRRSNVFVKKKADGSIKYYAPEPDCSQCWLGGDGGNSSDGGGGGKFVLERTDIIQIGFYDAMIVQMRLIHIPMDIGTDI